MSARESELTGSRSTIWVTPDLGDLTGVNEPLDATCVPCLCAHHHLPCPPACPAAAVTDRIVINCCIIIRRPSPLQKKKKKHHGHSHCLPRSPCSGAKRGSAEWKSPRLWLTVLQSTSTWKNKLAPAGLSKWRHHGVKYRCNIPPFQLNPNKLKMSFLQDGYHREWS